MDYWEILQDIYNEMNECCESDLDSDDNTEPPTDDLELVTVGGVPVFNCDSI